MHGILTKVDLYLIRNSFKMILRELNEPSNKVCDYTKKKITEELEAVERLIEKRT